MFQGLNWCLPAQRSHRKAVVVPAIIKLELPAEVFERIKSMSGIKTFIIFAMASFYLTIMPRGKGADHFMLYAILCQTYLKESGLIAIGSEAVGKLGSVIGLNTFDRHGKAFYQVIQKLRR